MSATVRRLWAKAKSRPKTAALAACALFAAGLSVWFTGAGRSETATLTALRAAPAARRVAPPAPAELQARLNDLAEAWREPIGVAVMDVGEGWTAQVDGLSRYPQQSVVKLWVALAVMDAVDHGRLTLDRAVVVRPQDRSVFYQPIGARIGAKGYATTVEDLLRRALTESDNTANDKLISELGGGEPISRLIAAKGLSGVAVGGYEREMQARTAGLKWRPELAGWRFKEARAALPDAVRQRALDAYLADPQDGATPVGVVQALAALQRGELLSRPSTAVMLGLMGQARTGERRLKGGLPSGWAIAHKTGTGPDWRGASVGINDVGLITAPDGRVYAVAVMLRETRKPVPQRLALMQAVSRAVVEAWRSAPPSAPETRVAVAAKF